LLVTTDHEAGKYGPANETRAQSRARNIDRWYNSIDTLSVYIFDENERFVYLWRGPGYTPGQDYEIPLTEICLPEGVYTFIAWSNLDRDHFCNMHDSLLAAPNENYRLADMFVNMRLDDDGGIKRDRDHRHYGKREGVHVANNSILDPKQSNIVLNPVMHRVNFTVVGQAPSKMDQQHTVRITDRNHRHSFLNRFIGTPETRADGDEFYHQIRTMTDVTGLPGGPGAWDDPTVPPPPGIDPAQTETLLSSSVMLLQLHDVTKTGVRIFNEQDEAEALATNDKNYKPILDEPDLEHLIQEVYAFNSQRVNFDETLEFDITVFANSEFYLHININGWNYIRNKIIM
jgi:hypothetical protein